MFNDAFAVHLINLKSRPDRLRQAKKSLASIGLEIGSNAALFSAVMPDDAGVFCDLGPGVRGCFESQLACLTASQGRHALILEDDVTFAPTLKSKLPGLLHHLETIPWAFCYLGHEGTNVPRLGRSSRKSYLTPYSGYIISTHCVMIHKDVVPAVIAHLHRIQAGTFGDQMFGPMPIDGAYNIFRKVNPHLLTVISDPRLAWQRPSRSDISPGRFDAFPFARPLVDAARVVKHLVLG